MLDLPRSVRLAAWGSAVLAGRADLTTALAAVQGHDQPHTVAWPADVDGLPALPRLRPDDLTVLLAALAESAPGQVLLALPVPGDPSGLPGPAAVNIAALQAEECVVVELAATPARWALIPEVRSFGSELEPGVDVTWTAAVAAPRRAPESSSLAESERELRTALATAARVLADLDVARWREDAARRIEEVRAGALAPDTLPPSTPPRAARVLASAAQVLAIVELAVEDDGAALTGHEAGARTRALREVGTVARRALVTAVNVPGPA
ncbi:hypothetical protein ACFFKU_12450 [Kineococcus gynurae]|uniref:Uncharacterized protein n=1 Tax=Kineococcus gynurae TaxID=452979 RepID=A0ABV5LQQ5_9ACTN